MSNGTPSARSLEGQFWDGLKQHFKTYGINLMTHNHNNRNYYNIALGRTGFSLNFVINTLKNWLRCEIFINRKNPKKAYDLLEKDKDNIKKEMRTNLDWQGKAQHFPGHRIAYYYNNTDIWEKKNWPDYFKWFEKYGLKFHQAFAGRIKLLKL